MFGFMQTSFFFGYMLMAAYAAFIMLGTLPSYHPYGYMLMAAYAAFIMLGMTTLLQP